MVKRRNKRNTKRNTKNIQTSDKTLASLKKKNDHLAEMHDKQLKEMDKQHEKSLRLLEYQHQQSIKNLTETYEREIQRLSDETENKSEVKAKLQELERELEGRLQEVEDDYNNNVRELNELKESNQDLKQDYDNLKQDYTATRETLQRSNEMRQEHKVELDRTKTRLAELKREYQSNIKDLKNALQVSQDHLQTSYEMISKIRDEKEQMKEDHANIKNEIQEHKKRLKNCGQERKQLLKKVKMHQMDATDYNTRLNKIREKEKSHKLEIANKSAQLEEKKQREQQYKAAIRQTKEEMRQEKQKHLALRGDYEDYSNRLAALNEALQACEKKSVDAQEVMRNMSDRYNALRKKTEQMMGEMRKLSDEKEMHRQKVRDERKRSQVLQESRQEMETKLREADVNHLKTYQLLGTCQKKNNACLTNTKARQEYVEKLEREIKRSMKALKTRVSHNRETKQLQETVHMRDEELLSLKNKLKELRETNQDLKAEIKSFDQTKEMTNQLLVSHKNLKQRHAQALKWIEEMKGHHQALHEKEIMVGKKLDQTNQNLNQSEINMQKASQQIRALEEKRKSMQLEIRSCLYAGEKERLENQLLTVIKDRDALRSKMDQMISEHDGMYRKVKLLAEENKNLMALKEKYEMDVDQMRQITEQGAELNVQLIKSQKLLKKKDKQLDLLSTQLGSLIRRVKILEEREAGLKQQLSLSANPEEVELIEEKLILCRRETKDSIIKLQEMKQVAKHMEEQNKVHKEKIKALVTVIKDNELVKDELQKERMVKVQVEEALRDCQNEQAMKADERKRRFQEMNDQFETHQQNHLNMMQESKARIADLQSQLERAQNMQRHAYLKARLQNNNNNNKNNNSIGRMNYYYQPEMKVHVNNREPMTINESIRDLESSTGRITSLTRGELAQLQKQAQQENDFRQAAIQSQNLNSLKQLQELRKVHQQVMRDKEQEIMNIRADTYNRMLDTLQTANNANVNDVNTNELYTQIKDIRQRNAQREQASMSDMLRLRAINEKLSNEYKQARLAQWGLLHQANVQQRGKILQESALGPRNQDLYDQVQQYQNLVESQKSYLHAQRDDVMNDLRNQRQYIYELQRQLPKMQAIENSINAQRFPQLEPLRRQIQQERTYTIGALPGERKEATGMMRTTSALESQLKALNASVNSLTQTARQVSETKTNTNTDQLRRLASMSPGQIEQELRRQEAMGDNSALRTTFVVHPRTQSMGPPGRRLAADVSTGEVQVKGLAGDSKRPQRFFADEVSMYQSPKRTFAPTVARAVRTVQDNSNLIVVTYGFESNRMLETGKSIKYLVFLHALQEIWPQVQGLSDDGSLTVQLVRVLPAETRVDLLDQNHALQRVCTYNTCQATERKMRSIENATQLMEQIATQVNDNEEEKLVSHTILTLSVPNSAARIHICDVLYQNVPDMNAIKLLDSSWITYLSDVLQQPNVKLDLFFNVLPGNTNDVETDNNNQRLLQVSESLQRFIREVKKLPESQTSNAK